MCSSKPKLQQSPYLEQRKSLKKSSHESLIPPPLLSPLPATTTKPAISPPISPKLPSPRPPALKRGKDPNDLNSSLEKLILTPKSRTKLTSSVKKSKKSSAAAAASADNVMKNISSLIVEAPGSIAAARREQVATMQEQRKLRIAHYGRTKSAKFEGKVVPLDSSAANVEQRRCSFITPNSDPIYVAYHDEEWGVPVHDDNLLLELLVLTGAQVGSDWTSVLRKRQALREAFSGFDAEPDLEEPLTILKEFLR
ncbi:hypothetical protein M0R45_014070 [Rubus argutus]|uniref:DNA-3-methyladenine glycosylase I n=1 Tax=Rubus argutus TaxID=59490 RepID=A0AAW1XL61_RUBAR